ncbi:MAG: Methyltransferase type 12 [Parachlamydiales bacterium]|nr:Methyltransferase type 12 [Parachlamydiales bacterium]
MEELEIQEVKAYWDRQPCNIRHSNKAIGSKEYFDEVIKLLSAFDVYSCQKRHIFCYKLKKYKRFFYQKKFPWNFLPSYLLERFLGWHYLIKARYKLR